MDSRPRAHTNNADAGLPHDSLTEYIAELERRIFFTHGEAYLGLLRGDDTPTPEEACHAVIEALTMPAARLWGR